MAVGGGRRIPIIVLALVAIAAAVFFALRGPPTAPVVQVLTTQPLASQPASKPATKPKPPRDFMGVVRATYPDFPATQPLPLPVELHEGARLIINDPILLDSAQELWITRPDAPPTAEVLKNAADEQAHLIREHVVFVHRFLNDSEQWQPQLICRQSDGTFVLIDSQLRLNLGAAYAYQWNRAFSWNSTTNTGFVVPTDTGVSVFRPRSLPVELHYDFTKPATRPATIPDTEPTTGSIVPHAEPQMLLDARGLLAWIPWENYHSGSEGAARFVDGKWTPLGPTEGWPAKIVHLVPLLDGNVIQLFMNVDDTIGLSMTQLDTVDVDRKVVDPLIEQLSDPDPKIRDSAYAELTRYGSGLWPILEKVIDEQPPEGHARIEQLLSAKTRPTLGGMTLLPGRGRMVSRFSDGGAMLFAEEGVSVPNNDPSLEPVVTAPAYISFRPGQPIKPAPASLVNDLAENARIDVAPDESIVTDDAHGPQRLLGNHLEPLLRKGERGFSQFVGIDRRGRWLFRKTDAPTPTLVLDPTLPDATPRLPGWVDPAACDVVGWDEANWPVVMKSDNAWAIHAGEWAPLPAAGKSRKFYKSLDEMPKRVVALSATLPTTLATTQAATTTAATAAPATTESAANDEPIFVDTDGTRYFDGLATIKVIRPGGTTLIWPLPPTAVGSGEVHLLRGGEDRLFLFNQAGRVLRIKPTPKGDEPFKLEATFTDRIPNTDHYARIWLDPAGRIDVEYETNHLVMFFPDGRIPRPIAEKMPPDQLKDAADE